MTKFTITLENAGGILEEIHTTSAETAKLALIELVQRLAFVSDGDVLRISNPVDDD